MMLDLLTKNDETGRYPPSYYAATMAQKVDFPKLRGDRSVDVCIIGGGYTGLSAALHLREQGRGVVLVEANRVGWGASGRNGGQAGTGQRINQEKLEKTVGEANAKKFWTLAEEGKSTLHALINTYGISCNYKPGIIHADHRATYREDSRRTVDHLRNVYDYDAVEFLDQAEVRELVGSDLYFSGMLDRGAGHLHPLNFALGLADACMKTGVEIYENTKAVALRDESRVTIDTPDGTISAEHCLIACNGYLGNFGEAATRPVRRKVMPINNFIVVSEPLEESVARNLVKNNHAVADSRFVVNYFRMVDDDKDGRQRLLFGGGETYRYRFPKNIAAIATKPMNQIYPVLRNCKVDYAWGGTLAITMNRMPLFQRLSPRLYSAGGYSGHGVVMATMGGRLMAEAICGDSDRFDLFSHLPSLSFPGGALMRWPLLALAMSYYSLRDKL